MSMRNLLEQAAAGEVNPEELHSLLRKASESPNAIVSDLLQARRDLDEALAIAEKSEALVNGLVDQNSSLVHLEAIRPQPDGSVRAICRSGGQLQELGVLPQITREELEALQTWDYLMVHEGVVIKTWTDDPLLRSSQMGDIVTFDGYANREESLVRVTRPGHDEAIVTLAGDLRLEELKPGSKLILQRDDARWAIAALPPTTTESRFEVSLDRVSARLNDLAGVEEISEAFLKDILIRLVYPELRERFGLKPMNGALVYSYQPGMGKTVLCEALAVELRDFGQEAGFDVALFHVKPNQLKNMYWGEDGRIVRDLFASIRAREEQSRTRPLIVLVVFDEIDSLQKRAGSNQAMGAASHSDALEALLVEMQGIGTGPRSDGPAVHRLCIGLTNRPDRLDDALKRPGRFGDLVRSMPPITQHSASDIMGVYCRTESLPWWIDGEVCENVPVETIREQFLRPAVASIFPLVVASYATENQRTTDITAGRILAGVHYQDAVNRAKRRAALRQLQGDGIPAVCFEDIVDSLLTVAVETAGQMEADPAMLIQQLQIKVPVVRVQTVPRAELEQHRFLKVHSA